MLGVFVDLASLCSYKFTLDEEKSFSTIQSFNSTLINPREVENTRNWYVHAITLVFKSRQLHETKSTLTYFLASDYWNANSMTIPYMHIQTCILNKYHNLHNPLQWILNWFSMDLKRKTYWNIIVMLSLSWSKRKWSQFWADINPASKVTS